MPKLSDNVIRPIIRALDDVPAKARGLSGTPDKLKSKQNRNRDGVGEVDKFNDNTNKLNSQSKPAGSPNGNSSHVAEFEVGSYRDLVKRALSGDGMQHDHIPSQAALIRAAENAKGRALDPDELNDLVKNAASVELLNALHYAGRTYGGKNSKAQIAADAADLTQAMENDLAALAKNLLEMRGLSQSKIDSICQEIRDFNKGLGIG